MIDYAIIGAGITGLSTAYFLAKQGFKVTVLDRIEKLGSQLQASSVNCGIMMRFENGLQTAFICIIN
jgi:glycine/D-amino acid oxidase-like deaminating enzyme